MRKFRNRREKLKLLLIIFKKKKNVDKAEYAISVTGKDKKIIVLHSRYWLTETSVYQ